jgi:hypothetical protein
MTMFETRIVCKNLPKSINDLDNIILSDDPLMTLVPIKNNNENFNQETSETNTGLEASNSHRKFTRI